MRRCYICGDDTLPLSAFVKDRSRGGGYTYRCIKCSRAKNKENYLKDRPRRQIKNNNRRAHQVMLSVELTETQWRELCEQHGNCCLCCGVTNVLLTIDHIQPLALGGSNHISNIQPLCQKCNLAKGTKVIDYRTQAAVSVSLQQFNFYFLA